MLLSNCLLLFALKKILLQAICFLSNHFDQIISCAQEAGEAADQDAKLVQAGDKKFKIARAKEKEFREGLEHTSSLLGYPSKIFRDSDEDFRKAAGPELTHKHLDEDAWSECSPL